MTVRAITFDATGTLIHSPRRVEIYTEVLVRHGAIIDSRDVERFMPEVWRELDCRTELGKDRFSAHAGGARGWWFDFLKRLCAYLEAPEPTPFTASELFHRFARPEAWEVFPEVGGTLRALREAGLSLAVVSNWDERLGPLLARLDLGDFFDAIVCSTELKIAKPDPRIFKHALDRLGVDAGNALHVGDSRRRDVEGAHAAGMGGLLLRRDGGPGDLADLSALPKLLSTVTASPMLG